MTAYGISRQDRTHRKYDAPRSHRHKYMRLDRARKGHARTELRLHMAMVYQVIFEENGFLFP